jgi:hypothetical protein
MPLVVWSGRLILWGGCCVGIYRLFGCEILKRAPAHGVCLQHSGKEEHLQLIASSFFSIDSSPPAPLNSKQKWREANRRRQLRIGIQASFMPTPLNDALFGPGISLSCLTRGARVG